MLIVKVAAGALVGYMLFVVAAIFLFGVKSGFWINAFGIVGAVCGALRELADVLRRFNATMGNHARAANRHGGRGNRRRRT